MASAQPVVQGAPPMVEVKNIFFKAHPTVNYFADDSQTDAIENDTAFQNFNRSLECSNKYGCLFLSFNNALYVLRASDVLGAQEGQNFDNLKKLEVRNEALPVAPNIIALSNGEDYLAVDTVRGDSGWLVIFRLADFINQGGSCRPFCEIRCSSTAAIRVAGIGWNPGENMNNMVAINTDDGSLFLAKVNGPSNVELSKLPTMDIRSLCWSPKGKQLVVGRTSGSLSQLKLDLTLAKQIPAPEPGCIPISILWTQTTQFLVVFQKNDGIDFMQLDVAKAAPPTYSNSGDIFISDINPGKSSCYFIPLVQWNAVITMTNTASDIVVLVKDSRGQNEFWIPGDVADNRRAAFLLDNYTRGVTVFYGSESGIAFSEVESYRSMPIVFLLSQRGSLSTYSIVNNNTEAPSLTAKPTMSVPDSLFSASRAEAKRPPPPQYQSPQMVQATPSPSQVPTQFQPAALPQESKQSVLPTATLSFGGPGLFQAPPTSLSGTLFSQSTSLFKSNNQPSSGTPPSQPLQFQIQNTQQQQQHPSFSPQAKPQTQSPNIFSAQQNQPISQKSGTGDPGQHQPTDLRQQMGTSTLPNSLDMAKLERAVEEKRREMTTQLQKGSTGQPLKGLEDDNQCAFVVSEVRKFEQRVAVFKDKTATDRVALNQLLNVSSNTLEKTVLSTLNSVEDFNSDMVSTTSAQKEEVEVLKERILNHFSQLEYAKSLVERSRDPRYLEHLRSRPLDPASQQKFEEISKLHNYIQNQVSECRRYFYEQNRKRDMPLDRAPNTQLIYMTLSNHSKIIRRLKVELDNIKERLGLGKQTNAFDEAEFLAVCEASYSGAKKNASVSSKQNEDPDEITLSDLTAGISKVKLNRDSSRPDKKPIQFSGRKLLILSKRMAEVSVVKVKADETAWTRTPAKSTKTKPVAYTTTEKSFSTRQIEPTMKSDITPPSFGSTYVINSDSNTPLNTGNNGVKSLLKTTLTAKSGSLLGNMSNIANNSNQTATSAMNFQEKAVESSTFAPPKSTFSPNPSAITKSPSLNTSFGNITGKGFAANSASPTMQQLPTLAELLATPPSVSPFTGASKGATSTPNAANTAFPGLNISFGSPSGLTMNNKSLFGAGAFSAAFQQGEVTSTNAADSSASAEQKPSPQAASGVFSKTSNDPSSLHSTPRNTNTSVIGSKTPQPANTTALPSAERHSFTPSSGGSFSSVSSGYTADEAFQSRPSSFPLSLSTSTATIAASLERSSYTSTRSPGTGSIVSSTPAAVRVSESSAPLNFSRSDAVSKNSNIPATTSMATTGGLFGSSGLSLGSPSSGGGASSIFGQPTIKKESAPEATVTVASLTPKTLESTISSTTTTTSAAGIGATFGFTTTPQTTNPASTSITGGLFSSSLTPPSTTQSIFSSGGTASFTSPVSTAGAGAGLLGNAPTTTATATLSSGIPPTGLFGSAPTTAASSVFSPSSQTPAAGSLFSSPSTTSSSIPPVSAVTTTTSSGLFSTPAAGFFSQISAPSGVSGTTTSSTGGFMSSLSLSDPSKTSTLPATTATGGVFSNPFGTSSPSAGSIFGGSNNAFTSQTVPTGTSQASPSIFGNPSTAASSVFGGAPAFGSSSPFGSSFGGTSTSAFGGGSASVFGTTSTTTSTTQSAGFGQLAQQTNTSPFGGNLFGGAGQQQQHSVFASPPQKPASGGLFSSTFASPTSTTAASIFGSGASSFGATAPGGAFSAVGSAGGVAQHGFGGFAQSKPPAATSVFGSPPSGAPVFGGGATFGSTSPFGSSFSSPAAASFGSTGASVFGGGAAVQTNAGFGALAQQGTASPGFGSPGFGGGVNQQQSASLFGSPPPQQQQQQAKPTFGGNAFSSWR